MLINLIYKPLGVAHETKVLYTQKTGQLKVLCTQFCTAKVTLLSPVREGTVVKPGKWES